MNCKYCGSDDIVKNGTYNGTQRYLCRNCGHRFTNPDAPEGAHYSTVLIANAVSSFYDGSTEAAIRRSIHQTFGTEPSTGAIYKWIKRYTEEAMIQTRQYRAQCCSTWYADETVLDIGGRNVWFWDIIDYDSRFLLASHLSVAKTTADAKILMRRALANATCAPRAVITDKLAAYLEAVRETFGPVSPHFRSKGFIRSPNTNIIERFHGTLKDRTKVMRGMKSMETARFLMAGWLVHYNYFRPHSSIQNRTPAQAACIRFPYHTWREFIAEAAKAA